MALVNAFGRMVIVEKIQIGGGGNGGGGVGIDLKGATKSAPVEDHYETIHGDDDDTNQTPSRDFEKPDTSKSSKKKRYKLKVVTGK